MKRELKAFTMIEITLVLVIIGTFFVVLVSNFFSKSGVNDKKMAIQSNSFYGEIEKAVMKIAFDETGTKGIKSLTTQTFAQHLYEYITGSSTGSSISSCSKFKTSTEVESEHLPNVSSAKCFTTSQDFLVATLIDSNCNTKVYAKEYFSEKAETREVTKACGFVAYEPEKNAQGVFGKDLFVIPLGNRGVK